MKLACGLVPVTLLSAHSNARPVANAEAVSEADAPVIDGVVAEPAWEAATPIIAFKQVEPQEGAPATEPTSVRLLRGDRALYIAIEAGDSEPDRLVADRMERDGDLSQDDSVMVVFDPSNTGRNGFAFEVNPRAARRDAVVQNNAEFLTEWDAIWTARATVSERGWSAEIEIPFRSLAFDQNAKLWGFQVRRFIARKNEEVRWSSIRRERPIEDISDIGALTGISDVIDDSGLDVQLYGAAAWSQDTGVPDTGHTVFSPSANILYRLTPQLTGTVTINPDFSDTPLDARRVNITQFDLFFPETRDFFLQDVAVFEFGGGNFNEPNGRPFFSRRMGIDRGQIIGIDGGVKLSGAVRDVSVGVLSVATNESPTQEEDALSVARFSTPLLRDSKAGIIMTSGDASSDLSNTVVGADFQYRKADVLQDQLFLADFYYLLNELPDGQPESFGFFLDFPNDRWMSQLGFKQIDEGFNPGVGFVTRDAIRQYRAQLIRRWRPNWNGVRYFEAAATSNVMTTLDDEHLSGEHSFYARIELDTGDGYWLNLYEATQRIEPGFVLPGGVAVPPGDYDGRFVNLYFTTATTRPLSAIINLDYGEFLGGRRSIVQVTTEWRPSRHLKLGLDYSGYDITLKTGDTRINVVTADVKINFTPDIQLLTQIQYDNVSEDSTMFSRLRWELEPGTELFAAVGHSRNPADEILRLPEARESSAVLRFGHTFRF